MEAPALRSAEDATGGASRRGDGAIEAFVAGPGHDAWYGVYLEDAKVGHAHIWYRRAATEEPGAFAMAMDMSMSIAGGGEMTMSEVRHYGGAPSYRLVAARFELRASGVVDVRELTAKPTGVHLTRTLNGAARPPRELPPTRDALTDLRVTNPLAPRDLTPGAEADIYTWDWERYADDHVTVTVEGVEHHRRAGVEVPVARLELRSHDNEVTMHSVVAPGGAVLQMMLGPALRLRQEEAEVARSGVTGLDILGSGVPVSRKLGSPGSVERLVLRTRLPEGYRLPAAPNQRLRVDAQGRSVITLVRGAGAEVTAEQRAEALASGPVVDWREGGIAELAGQLTSGLSDARQKVRALSRWVFGNLDKRLATHLPTASLVLAQRFGDCTEHTWLLAALARASGVPARPVYGLAYSGDADATFAYHAWVEVAFDGHWWPVDPTWDEPVADATHLKLGAELAAVGGVIGGLSLEVLDVERAAGGR